MRPWRCVHSEGWLPKDVESFAVPLPGESRQSLESGWVQWSCAVLPVSGVSEAGHDIAFVIEFLI